MKRHILLIIIIISSIMLVGCKSTVKVKFVYYDLGVIYSVNYDKLYTIEEAYNYKLISFDEAKKLAALM